MNILSDLSNNIKVPVAVAPTPAPKAPQSESAPDETLGQKMNDIKNFGIYMATFIGTIFLYVIIGIALLYLSKLFQTPLIPDILGCFPYTDNQPGAADPQQSQNPLIDINRVYSKETGTLQSEKLLFDYATNKDGLFLNRLIHKWASIYRLEEKPSGLVYWIGSFIHRFYYANMVLLGGFFGLLKTVTLGYDFLILLLGPAALGIYILINMILIYPIYIYSFLPPLYFVSCKNTSTAESPHTWQPQIGKNTSWASWITYGFFLVFWFSFAAFFCIPPLTQILSFVTIVVLLLAGIITAHGEKIVANNEREPYGFLECVKDTLKFKSWLWMMILTVGILQGVPLFFNGVTSAIVVFVLVLLILFEWTGWEYNPLPIYSQIMPDYGSPVGKETHMEKKDCGKMPAIHYEPFPADPNRKGFLDRWFDWLVDKGLFVWSLTPTGRAATVASKVAEAKLGVNPLNMVTNVAASTVNPTALTSLSPIGSPVSALTPAPAPAQGQPKPVKPMMRKLRGGGLAQTIKRIIAQG